MPLRREVLRALIRHQRLLLATARCFKSPEEAYARAGEVAEAYRVVCEEYGEEPSGTQISMYLRTLARAEGISTRPSGAGARGMTTLISLKGVPAEELVDGGDEVAGGRGWMGIEEFLWSGGDEDPRAALQEWWP